MCVYVIHKVSKAFKGHSVELPREGWRGRLCSRQVWGRRKQGPPFVPNSHRAEAVAWWLLVL